jgi:SAM-dependent methyltransferase
MFKTANRIYRNEGLSALVTRLAHRLRRGRNGVPYQTKLESSFEERWKMIASVIPSDSKSLLDIGSNLGAFTARSAAFGLWSVGIEKSKDLVDQARRNHEDVAQCAFMWSEFKPEDCAKVPHFDVSLILSVHHHWHQSYGPDVANRMLQDIVGKTDRVVIFEGPSRSHRYGEKRPVFVDNNEDSVTNYYKAFLEETVGRMVTRVLPLGKGACVGEREPYRWMYALIR